jgi:hypothetical protein
MAFQAPTDPLRRYLELADQLNRRRRWWESATYHRLAALAGLCAAGEPTDVTDGIRAAAESLKQYAGWFGPLSGEFRYVVAAILYLHDVDPTAFSAEVDRVRRLFRTVRLSRSTTSETLTALVMRISLKQAPITLGHVERLAAMFAEMKAYHRWLTGTEDYPICGLLALRDLPPGLVAQQVEQVYEGLRGEGLAKSDALQAGAGLLYLSAGRAELAVDRAGELIRRFRSAGEPLRKNRYGEVAILAFLHRDPQEIVARVAACRDEIRRPRPRPDKTEAFKIACSITFLEMMHLDEQAVSISHAKLLLDVQAVIAAQQAAMAGAVVVAGA